MSTPAHAAALWTLNLDLNPREKIQPSATDGVHLTSEGIALYSRLIARAVRVGGAGAGS